MFDRTCLKVRRYKTSLISVPVDKRLTGQGTVELRYFVSCTVAHYELRCKNVGCKTGGLIPTIKTAEI